MAARPKDVPEGTPQPRDDSKRDDQGAFSGDLESEGQADDPRDVADLIEPPIIASISSTDDLAQREARSFANLPPKAKVEYHLRENQKIVGMQLNDWRCRCETYEKKHAFFVARVAELEQSERSTKASFDSCVAALSVGGTIIGVGGLIASNTFKWLFSGVGIGLCVLAGLQSWHLRTNGWPPRRDAPGSD